MEYQDAAGIYRGCGKELATAAEAFMDENRKDVSVYKAKTDHVEMAARGSS